MFLKMLLLNIGESIEMERYKPCIKYILDPVTKEERMTSEIFVRGNDFSPTRTYSANMTESENGEFVKFEDIKQSNIYVCPMCNGQKPFWDDLIGHQCPPPTCSLCFGKGYIIDKENK